MINNNFLSRIKFVIKFFFVFTLVIQICYLAQCAIVQKAEPVYKRYTVNDGLPSSTVYHAFQDSKGYIWFATSNGVSRFDGYKFVNFDIQSGLVDNDVFEIYEDYKHRIWFIPMSGKLCYFEDGKVHQYKYNDLIAKYTSNTRGPVKKSFYVDNHDFVYLSMKSQSRFSISPEGVLRVFNNKENYGIEFFEISKDKVLVSFSGSSMSRNLRFDGIEYDFEMSLSEFFNKSYHPVFSTNHIFLNQIVDSSITIISINGALIKIKGKKVVNRIVPKKNDIIIWTSLDQQNNIWVSNSIGGVQLYDHKNIDKKPLISLLENYKITSVLFDDEGAYWFTTLNDGVFYCSNINVLNLKHPSFADNRVNAVLANKNGLFIGYEFGFVDFLKRNGSLKYYNSPNPLFNKNSVRSFFDDSTKNRTWICSSGNLSWIENEKLKTYGIPPNYDGLFPRRIISCSGGGYWIAATKGLAKCVDDIVTYKSYTSSNFNELIYDLTEDYKQRVWLCTVRGIWIFKDGFYNFLGNDNSHYNQTFNSIITVPIDSSIWLGSNGNGIVINKKDRITKITTKEGLASNSITQLVYKNKSVWVATRNGLSRVILDGERYTIKNYTRTSGLLTNEISSISEYNDTVFLGTPEGICYFNKMKVEECNNPPKIIISKFSAKDKSVDLNLNCIEFDYTENSFSIDFVGFVYRNEGKVNYRYRMLGVDSSWVYSQTPNCQYNGLSDGKYKFEVEAQNYVGTWSTTPASIEFSIFPPFWKRIWFLGIMVILFSGLFFMIHRIRINSINNRNELLQNINLYKQQSLRQQMNPHFIFNTLNSIQLYILEKDTISSHKYLSKFARLMRITLDNSIYSSIPIKDELEALRIYLDLEKLRIEDGFEYSINYGDNETILNYGIPTLLIQPFVENAIWHGISLRKDRLGFIKIAITDDGNVLKCTIEDNGVGRVAADLIRQSRRKEHKSRGSQITLQRLDLLNQMYRENFSIEYNDLYDSEGFASGTNVTITIPKDIKVYNNK